MDGFNLYYGCIRGTQHRWLDLSRLFSLLLPSSRIERIRYFTARVRSRKDPTQGLRQELYLRALRTIPNLTIRYGHFLTHVVSMPLAHSSQQRPPTVDVLRTEEKGSDVNLAMYLLIDGFRDEYDLAVVVSNDSDLIEPIRFARRDLGKQVGILAPHNRPSRVLRSEADFLRPIRQGPLQASQFHPTLSDASGSFTKPWQWQHLRSRRRRRKGSVNILR